MEKSSTSSENLNLNLYREQNLNFNLHRELELELYREPYPHLASVEIVSLRTTGAVPAFEKNIEIYIYIYILAQFIMTFEKLKNDINAGFLCQKILISLSTFSNFFREMH